MTDNVRGYLDFWIENSVHAREQYGSRGAEQGIDLLVANLLASAETQGFSEKQLIDEVGDLATYIRGKLGDANQAEKDRHG